MHPGHRKARLLLIACAAACAMVLLTDGVHSRPNHVAAAVSGTPPLTDPDRACARCHSAIYNSYEQTSMARGSGLATEALHSGSYRSAASGVTFHLEQRDGQALLTSRRESTTQPLDDTERLEYFIGSGLHGRTYLFRRTLPGTDSALWYEAPVNWYTRRNAYAMAPAWDNAPTAQLAMPTEPNCLHCHATNVAEPVEGVQNRYAGAPFRQGGVGCSACHGDMSAHVGSGGKAAPLRLASLVPKKQDSVCLQCHLEGDAVVQRAGRSIARFTPGEDLDDTALYFVNAASAKTAARASSQYEGLLRSACRRAAGERLTCVTCHDPHSEPAPAERVAFYRGKCLQCHGESATFHPATHHAEQQDCAQCHMPSRATSDIAHEQNADHDIEARHDKPVAKLAFNDAFRYAKAVDLQPVGLAKADDRELGLAYAQFAARGDGATRDSFARAWTLLSGVERAGQADAMVHQQLGYLLQLAGKNDAARSEYEADLKARPHDVTAITNLAVLQASAGATADAIALLQKVSDAAPDQTPALLNLAMLQCKAGRAEAAKQTLQRAITFQPDSTDARRFLSTGDYSGLHCRVF